MKKEFEAIQKHTVNSVTIDAVNFIMENVFDWEGQTQHGGLRMNYQDCRTLVKSLKANLGATCPDVGDHDITDLYGELLHNNWAGEFPDIKDLTYKVVIAYMEAEMGNLEPATTIKRQMKGKIAFMETHYSEVSHSDNVPSHVMAEAMDKGDARGGGSLESRKSSVLAMIQNKRGGIGDLFDGEQDPALLKIVQSLHEASTDEELVVALESLEDYLTRPEMDALGKASQRTEISDPAPVQKEEASSLATRLKQKLPVLTRFFG
jgi:hypothetical protein